MNDHSPSPVSLSGPTHAVLAAHTGVALVRTARGAAPGTLIDPTRAALVRLGWTYEITAIAPSAQELGVLSFASGLLGGLGAPSSHLDAARADPVAVRWAPRLTLALQLLARSGGETDSERVERRAVRPILNAGLAALLREVFEAVHDTPPDLSRPRPRAHGDHRELARSTKILLTTCPERRHRLADVARAVNASPFHLEHVFNAEAGIPLRRFLLDLRLALALARLAESDVRLNDLALGLGFATHSHFSAAFRRRIGETPSAVRQMLRARIVMAEASGPSPGARVGRFNAWIRMLRMGPDAAAVTIEWPPPEP